MSQTLIISKLQALIAEIRPFFPDTSIIIAGGAVRDLLHSRPVSDIDVFLTWPENGPWEQAYEFAKSRADSVKWASGKDGYKYIPEGFSVCTLLNGLHMHPIQLVCVDATDPREVASAFDYGLCQCWVDERRVGWSSAYFRDADRKRFTYYPQQDNKPENFESRRAKLQAKYAGWPFVGGHPEMGVAS